MNCNRLNCCNNHNGCCLALIDDEKYKNRCNFFKTREELYKQKKRISKAQQEKDYVVIKMKVLGGNYGQ